MSEPMPISNCPNEETLAAFLDGRLDSVARQKVMEHVAQCGDCRDVVMVATELAASGDPVATVTPVAVPATPVLRFSPRATFAAAAALAAAAVLVVVFGPALRERFTPRPTSMQALVGAADHLEYRPIAPRISAGMSYRPLWTKRSGPNPVAAQGGMELSTVAGVIAEAAKTSPTVENLHALGVSHLLHGKGEEAVDHLESALRMETGVDDVARAMQTSRNARLLTDLSAAYYVRRQVTRHARDAVSAFEFAHAAWKLEQTPETAWNRALALQAFGPRADAIAAWEEFLRLDGNSDWAKEARQYIEDLRSDTDTAVWDRQRPPLDGRTPDRAALSTLAVTYPQFARAFVEDVVLPAWGNATLAGDTTAAAGQLAIASAMAAGIAGNGDLLLQESTDAIRQAEPRQVHQLATGHSLYGEGWAKSRNGDHVAAAVAFDTAARELQTGGSPFYLFARFQVAVCRYMRNEYAESGQLLAALDAAVPHERYRSLGARMQWVGGLTDEQAGQATRAFGRYRAAMQTFADLKEKDNEAATTTLAAETLQRSAEDDEAMELHLRSIALIEQSGSPFRRHQVLFEAAYAALEQNRLDVAELLLDRVWVTDKTAQRPTDPCVTLIWRSVLHSRRGAPQRAAADLQEADRYCQRIPDERVRERAMTNFTLAAAVAKPSVTSNQLASTIGFLEANNSRLWLRQLYSKRATAYQKEGQRALAERDLRRGIEEVEAAEGRARFTSSITGVAAKSLYEMMIALCIDQRRHTEALEYADRANLRTNSALFRVANNVATVMAGVRAEPVRDVTARLQSVLPEHCVVVNFFQLPERLLIWTVRKRAVGFHEVEVSAAELNRLTARFGSADSVGTDRALAARLSDLLLSDWIGEVAEDETVVIAGEPAVRILPLPALAHPKGGVLAEHVAISTSATLSQLLTAIDTDAVRAVQPKMLFVAASTPNLRHFPGLGDLPHAAREVRAAAQRYPGATVLSGAAARKDAFLAATATASLIQFAGHAVIKPRAPLFSGLIFSGHGEGDAVDETLYMHEVSSSTFPSARLVVLTACSTGRQVLPNVSFATALLEQQVPSVLSSIWDADDRASAVLAMHFHASLRRGASRAVALREAQLAMLRSGNPSLSHPAAWAGFQLLGAFGTLYPQEHRNA